MKQRVFSHRKPSSFTSVPYHVYHHSDLKKLQREAAARFQRAGTYDYVREAVSDRLVDRVQDVSRQFECALDLGTSLVILCVLQTVLALSPYDAV